MSEKNKTSAKIKIVGARQNNLKNLSVEIPKNKMTVITGLSGSGKSSLAFDTIYKEGQRRYVEALSNYARRFFDSLEKPNLDYIKGLSPAISIDQKTAAPNPRSTVGTITESYDYLKLLFARIGQPHCPVCGDKLVFLTKDDLVKKVFNLINNKDRKELIFTISFDDISQVPKKVKSFLQEGKIVEGKRKLDKKSEAGSVIFRFNKGEDVSQEKAEKVVNGLLSYKAIFEVWQKEKGEYKQKEIFSDRYYCPKGHFYLDELTPNLFSFNSPLGACPDCHGLGVSKVIEPDKLIPSKKLTIEEGAIQPWGRKMAGTKKQLEKIKKLGVKTDKPFNKLSKKERQLVLYGKGAKDYQGAIPYLEERYLKTDSDHIRKEIEKYMIEKTCQTCQGKRLSKKALSVKIDGKSIGDLVKMDVRTLIDFLENLKVNKDKKEIADKIIREIKNILVFLKKVGLDYLTLNRSSKALAGGEAQRVRLATQLGSSLSGVIYVLDEPTIGLHPSDIDSLLEIILKLKDDDSTIIVVEHDKKTIGQADWLIDMGPGAGVEGGEIVAQGKPADIKKDKKSLTGKYLQGKKEIPIPSKRREGSGKNIEIIKASQYNLADIDVKIPLNMFVCLTGVSGSGKSTLLYDILGCQLSKEFHGSQKEPGKHKKIKGTDNIDKVIKVDQSPIGRTPRSNPATYTNVFNLIRKEFARTDLAQSRGYDSSQFSFNVKKGRCQKCAGQGQNKIEMYFMDDIYITCPKCKGKRFNRETLEVELREKSIADILEMTVDEARDFFLNNPKIRRKLEVLQNIGLGYLRLGQPATTLSGGEAQRVKLAKELSRKSYNKTLYILDEPTTGLHFEDIKRLLKVISKLVDRGNSVLVIEHNLDIIKNADWLIDLGPGGGKEGGKIVAQGRPEEVADCKKSLTGKYLAKVLKNE